MIGGRGYGSTAAAADKDGTNGSGSGGGGDGGGEGVIADDVDGTASYRLSIEVDTNVFTPPDDALTMESSHESVKHLLILPSPIVNRFRSFACDSVKLVLNNGNL